MEIPKWIKEVDIKVFEEETPLVLINLDKIKENLEIIKSAINEANIDCDVYYALKANYFYPILETLKESGIKGVEIISSLERDIAHKAGFSNKQLIFNGLFREGNELLEIINEGGIVNIDSPQELKSIKNENNLSVGLRIYPEFEKEGNFIKRKSKLGLDRISFEECVNICKENSINIIGLNFHIFSNLTEFNDLKRSIKSSLGLIENLEKEIGYKVKYLDIGGGFSSPLTFSENPSKRFSELFSFIKEINPEIKVIIEAGRFLVNDAIAIISSVKGVKNYDSDNWVVLDIGTNYLIPALGSGFKVFPLNEKRLNNEEESIIVDAICSPAGIIEDNNNLGPYVSGEKVAVCNSGAYTSVMKEQFVFGNPKHIFLKDGKVIESIDKFELNDVLKYHGWRLK